MRVLVSKWGNSTAIRLPKAVVEELGLKPGQEAELSLLPGEARLKAVAPLRGKALLEHLLAEMDRLGPESAPPLEDWEEVETEWPPYETPDKSK